MNKKRYIWRPNFVLLTLAMVSVWVFVVGNGLVLILQAFYINTTDFTSWGGWLTLALFVPIVWYLLKGVSEELRPRLQPVPKHVVKALKPGENPKLHIPSYVGICFMLVVVFGSVVGWAYGYQQLFGLNKEGATIRYVVSFLVILGPPLWLLLRWTSRNVEMESQWLKSEDHLGRSVQKQDEA